MAVNSSKPHPGLTLVRGQGMTNSPASGGCSSRPSSAWVLLDFLIVDLNT